jgi:hypothetical protein
VAHGTEAVTRGAADRHAFSDPRHLLEEGEQPLLLRLVEGRPQARQPVGERLLAPRASLGERHLSPGEEVLCLRVGEDRPPHHDRAQPLAEPLRSALFHQRSHRVWRDEPRLHDEARERLLLFQVLGVRLRGARFGIEIAGAGMVDLNVFGFVREHGYDPERVQGFAFGFGIDRIAMLKHAVPDLRMLFENDLRFLEQF